MVGDGSGNIKLKSTTADKEFAPEEISAQVLRKLCGDAGAFLGADVKKVRHARSHPPPSHCLRLSEGWLFAYDAMGASLLRRARAYGDSR